MLVKISNLIRFEAYAGKEHFFEIFGEAAHELWDIYKNKCNQRVTDFYTHLFPIENREKLIHGINKF